MLDIDKIIRDNLNLDVLSYEWDYHEENFFLYIINVHNGKSILNVDIDIESETEIKKIKQYLKTIIENFDFSFTLEFYDIGELETWSKRFILAVTKC